jgi:hypothetical protein
MQKGGGTESRQVVLKMNKAKSPKISYRSRIFCASPIQRNGLENLRITKFAAHFAAVLIQTLYGTRIVDLLQL